MLNLSSYNGNQYVGVFSCANENISLIPNDSSDTLVDDMESALQVKCIKTTIASTNLIGALVAMNSYGAIVASMASDVEVESLSRHLAVYKLDDRYNAAGNNILVNDKGALINPDIDPKLYRDIAETLQVEVVPGTVAGQNIVGSMCAATNKGMLCHPESTKAEFEVLHSVLKVKPAIGTLNYGSGMVGACIVANSKGGAVGFRSTPIELGRVEDALGIY
ncbi:MAG: translation initiation factor IF-6 [Methanomassiliicoccales archaeon]|jgi:translation initiation factor 6